MHRATKWSALLILLGVCGLAAACSTAVEGTPSAAKPAPSGSLPSASATAPTHPAGSGSGAGSTAPSGSSSSAVPGSASPAAVLSRFRGVDACSLVTRSAFADLGQSVTGTAEQEPYDSCSLNLTVAKTAADLQRGKTIGFPDSVSVQDNLQFASLYQVQPKKVTVRGFTVLEGTSPQYGCIRNVQISPEVSVSDDTRGAAGIPACQAADDATRSIITTVDDHTEKRYAVPAGALVRQDLCQTLTGPARTLLGGAPTKVMHQLNGCVYIKDKAVLSIFLNGGAWTSEDQPANHTTWGGHDAYGNVAVKNGVGNVYGSLKLGDSPLGGADSYFLDARVPGVDQSFVAKFNAFAAALHN